MEQKKHYLVYRTTCLINGKIYIGQHQTYDLDDDYIGSGHALVKDISKFGRKNFKFEILFDFDNFEDMDSKERELVTEEFVAREDTYNLIPGGADGLMSISSNLRAKANRTRWNSLSDEERKHYTEAAHIATRNRNWTNESRKKISNTLKSMYKNHPEKNGMYGKKQSESARRKISEASKRNNFMKGKCWIRNPNTHECKVWDKNSPLPEGWEQGKYQPQNR